jgi:hypothetical protein
MELELVLTSTNAHQEIIELDHFISEANLKNVITNVVEVTAEKGAMSGGDYLPIIKIILGSTAIAATVRGILGVVKDYFVFKVAQQQRISEDHKIEFTMEDQTGKKIAFKINSFDESERSELLIMIRKCLKS